MSADSAGPSSGKVLTERFIQQDFLAINDFKNILAVQIKLSKIAPQKIKKHHLKKMLVHILYINGTISLTNSVICVP